MQEYRKAEEERQKARNAATAAGIEYVPKVRKQQREDNLQFIIESMNE